MLVLLLISPMMNQSIINVRQGGWAEHLLTHADVESVFDKYLRKCKDLGYFSRPELTATIT